MGLNLEGALLAERYQVHTRLAAGGMSVVYRGWDTRLCRPVAIKILRETDQPDVTDIARFRREARAAAVLHSPYIVESYDFFCEDSHYYMAMELVQGPHLKQYIFARGKLAPADALLIAEQVCLALMEAHEHGFLHRDIKPQNILLDRSGNAKLADFGIVHIAAANALTNDGIVLGTADYISPEQAQGLVLQPTSDIYSLGVVLFEMLAGVLPFRGTNSLAVAMQHATMPPPALRSVVPEAPREIERLVNRSLAKDPGQRFQSAYDMYMALCQVRKTLLLRPMELYPPYSWPTEAAAGPLDWRGLVDQLRESAGLARPAYGAGREGRYYGSHSSSPHGPVANAGMKPAATLTRNRQHEIPLAPLLLVAGLLVLLLCCIVFFHILV